MLMRASWIAFRLLLIIISGGVMMRIREDHITELSFPVFQLFEEVGVRTNLRFVRHPLLRDLKTRSGKFPKRPPLAGFFLGCGLYAYQIRTVTL